MSAPGKPQTTWVEVPPIEIRRFTIERDVREEAVRRKLQAGHQLNQQVTQKWDSAGRRSRFLLGDLEQAFLYRADGLLKEIILPRQNRGISYRYGTNGLLTLRSQASVSQASVSQTLIHDSLGRIKSFLQGDYASKKKIFLKQQRTASYRRHSAWHYFE